MLAYDAVRFVAGRTSESYFHSFSFSFPFSPFYSLSLRTVKCLSLVFKYKNPSPALAKARQLWPNIFPIFYFHVCWATAAHSLALLTTPYRPYRPTRYAFHYRRRIPVSPPKDNNSHLPPRPTPWRVFVSRAQLRFISVSLLSDSLADYPSANTVVMSLVISCSFSPSASETLVLGTLKWSNISAIQCSLASHHFGV